MHVCTGVQYTLPYIGILPIYAHHKQRPWCGVVASRGGAHAAGWMVAHICGRDIPFPEVVPALSLCSSQRGPANGTVEYSTL